MIRVRCENSPGSPRPLRSVHAFGKGQASSYRGLARARVLSIRTAAVLSAVLVLAIAARGQSSDRSRQIGSKLLCVCGCNQVLTACNHVGCTYSHGMLEEVDVRVARNEPDDLTLQAFVQEYGPTVLAEPPHRGFTRTIWIMPVVLPLIGLGLVWMVAKRWREKAALSGPAHAPAEFLARARHDADNAGEI